MSDNKINIYGIMNNIINRLNSSDRNLSGSLALIRHSIGKEPEGAYEVWNMIFPSLPLTYLGVNELTYEERAVFFTLQLYALSQQGTNKMVNINEKNSIGNSFSNIRDKDSTSIDKRFNIMLTANTFDMFIYYLRQFFKIAKTRTVISVDFAKLAEDLYWYQKGNSKKVCLRWARDYYKNYNDNIYDIKNSEEEKYNE